MTKEQAYDEKINPLMSQIIAICTEHKIAFLADFALDYDLKCTSGDVSDDRDPTIDQLRAFELLKPWRPLTIAVTTETKPNGDAKMTMKRLS